MTAMRFDPKCLAQRGQRPHTPLSCVLALLLALPLALSSIKRSSQSSRWADVMSAMPPRSDALCVQTASCKCARIYQRASGASGALSCSTCVCKVTDHEVLGRLGASKGFEPHLAARRVSAKSKDTVHDSCPISQPILPRHSSAPRLPHTPFLLLPLLSPP